MRRFFSSGILFFLAAICVPLGCADEETGKDDKAARGGFGADGPETGDLAEVLAKYVKESGLVDYAGLAADRDGLDGWINEAKSLDADGYRDPSNARVEKLAFWINFYNAATLQLIVEFYDDDLTSIQDLEDVGGAPPWDYFLFQVGGEKLTLNEIEHEIIRPIFAEPRIHFAVNCASISCPRLRTEPYQGDILDDQLEAAAVEFADSDDHVRFDEMSGTVAVNPVVDWYRDDFGGISGVYDFIGARLNDEAKIEAWNALTPNDLTFFSYDWSLNDSGSSSD
ncbi:MAG: DUF547 domain-containing protein [Deltaproteobacteria bacterium]|nr:DUF547 domain-containing protein [Deltaproteobacteria bacterium]MCB9488447.1 DUF547 domain-containing protein [Deltaproteobacteria bacterium]